jgi:hypothetical protein
MTRRLLLVILAAAAPAHAQAELGHKLLGTVGLDAGSQPPAGIYVANRLAIFDANDLMDRHGDWLPVRLDADGIANSIGVAFAIPLAETGVLLDLAASVPIAHASLSLDRPDVSLDRSGLSDIYVQPLRFGWRSAHLEAVAGYAFYVPTSRIEPGGQPTGVGRASWSHELSAGATVRSGPFRASMLASWEKNEKKIGIDLTRGDTIQAQGGAGGTILRVLDVGLVGYGLAQISDDRGSALPPMLRGARDRALGVGTEADLAIPAWRMRLTLRYTRDVLAASRPRGQLILIGLGLTFAKL